MLLKAVWSGGQTGVDISALRAAKTCDIPTGGWMPKGFRTLIGPKPQYARLYGMKEHSSSLYPPRTELNVKESDGTIRIAKDFNSAGEKCTMTAILAYNKACFDISTLAIINGFKYRDVLIRDVIYWMEANNVRILNVAGNSEQTATGIEVIAYNFLVELFKRTNEQVQAKEVLPETAS